MVVDALSRKEKDIAVLLCGITIPKNWLGGRINDRVKARLEDMQCYSKIIKGTKCFG